LSSAAVITVRPDRRDIEPGTFDTQPPESIQMCNSHDRKQSIRQWNPVS
jgi:hypothetical protein